MGRYSVSPHVYGAEVHLSEDSSYIVVPPSGATLLSWSRAALAWPTENTHTPFRTVEVRAQALADQPLFLHVGDICVPSTIYMKTMPREFPVRPWLQTLTTFVRMTLRECLQRPELCDVRTPLELVRQMLYRELGSCSAVFLKLLVISGLGPAVLDALVLQVWGDIVRLPDPTALLYVDDEKVKAFVVTLLQNKQSMPKGLRV